MRDTTTQQEEDTMTQQMEDEGHDDTADGG
jgi:hypothetical protein